MKKQEHKISMTIDASPEAAWKVIGAVGGVDEWLAPIKTCRVDGNKRYCSTDAGSFEEDILKVDNEKKELHYAIPEQNMIPVKNIAGMMKVRDGKGGKAVIDWEWNFDVEEKDEEQALKMLSMTGEMGIKGIEKLIQSRGH